MLGVFLNNGAVKYWAIEKIYRQWLHKGYRVDSIIKSIPTDFIKKNERKQFVYEVIYNYLISQKSVSNAV